MTRRQRIYFMWLVMTNAQKMIEDCIDREEATTMIRQAKQRRNRLGLRYSETDDAERIEDMERIVEELAPSGAHYQEVEPY